MLLVALLIDLVLIINFSTPKPALKNGIELSAKNPEFVQTLNVGHQEITRAIEADSLLLLLDYHGTLLESDADDDHKVQGLLKKISKDNNVQVVMTSGGPGREMLEKWGKIPRLLTSTDCGLKVAYEKTFLKSPAKKTLEEVEKIKQICSDVIGELIKSQGKNQEYKTLLRPYTHNEFSYRIHIDKRVDKDFRLGLLKAVQDKLNNRNLRDWVADIPASQKKLSIRLKGTNKANIAKTLIEGSIRKKKPFDYVIAMGDSEQDEDMFAYVNKNQFLPVLVDNGYHNIRQTFATFRLGDHFSAQKLLAHIADSRQERRASSIHRAQRMMTLDDYKELL